MARGAVHDRAQRRCGFFGEEWHDGLRDNAEGATGLGGVREWLPDTLLHYNDTYLSKEPALMTKLAATQRRDDTCS